jgi:hypothetical protein
VAPTANAGISFRGLHSGIELSGNKGSKTFVGLSLKSYNSGDICSTRLDFVDSEIYLRSRECMIPIMVFQTPNDFDSENARMQKKFDNRALFNFYLLDTFCPMGGLLSG